MTSTDRWQKAKRTGARRRRVLFVLPTLGGGGAERAFLTLLSHLDRSRFEPHLALLGKVGPYLKEVPTDVPLHDLKVFRVRYSLPSLIRLVWKLRPQVVLAAPREVNLAMAFARPWLPRDSKLLVCEQNSATDELAEKSPHPSVWRWLYRRLYPRADAIVCVADFVLNDLADHFGVPRQKMVRIYNPVDVEGVRQRAEECGNPYRGAGPHLVAVGRLTWQKGFDVLLEAMGIVRERVPLARLTILGEGPLESDLKAQSARLGLTEAVRFAGFQSNPYPYFRYADLFVLSSRYEGMPVVLLEALAVGTFVVAVDSPGGMKEILRGCSKGLLVPELNARLLADKIILGLETQRQSVLRPAGADETVDRFRIGRIVAAYEELFSA